jgi:hypothetical protein
MELNEDQLKIFNILTNHYLDKEFQIYLISGYAGTGKTTLITEFIRFLNENKKSVLVTAPTHKAVKVLRKMFGDNEDNEFCTTHSALSLKEHILNDGTIDFILNTFLIPKISSYDYIVVDEASMINEKLFYYILNYLKLTHSKLIFVGDSMQIPPVGYEISPVFNKEIQDKHKFKIYTLNNIVRQAENNPIIKLSTAIRQNIDKNVSLFKTKAFDTNKIYYYNYNYLEKLIDIYYKTEEYSNNPDYIKTVSWTNRVVDQINELVRFHLFGEEAYNKLVENEILVADDFIYVHGSKTKIAFQNNAEMKVLFYTESKKTVHGIKLNYYIVDVISLEDNRIYKIDIIHENSESEFNVLLEELKQIAIKAGLSKYWKTYYTAESTFAKVKYGYSISAHRSQGSTYENCIVIESDINKNRNIIERNKIKYTACTRTKENLFIVE